MRTKSLPTFETIAVLLNGNYGLFSIVLMVFGIFIFGSPIKDIDFVSMYKLSGKVETKYGIIIDVFETNYSVNEESVFGNEYQFDSPIGELSWVSYSNGLMYSTGDEVIVEYKADEPEINRIQGLSNSPGGKMFLLFPLLFLGSIIWFLVNIFKGRSKLNLLKNGVTTTGKLTDKHSTSMTVNDRTVYRMTFQYKDNTGSIHKVTVKTHSTYELEDEKDEKIIFHSDDPSKAVLVDNLPWTVPKYIKLNWY